MTYRYFWGPLPAGCLRILGGHFWSSQVWKDSHTSVFIYILHMNITTIYIYYKYIYIYYKYIYIYYKYIYILQVYIYIYLFITRVYIYITYEYWPCLTSCCFCQRIPMLSDHGTCRLVFLPPPTLFTFMFAISYYNTNRNKNKNVIHYK